MRALWVSLALTIGLAVAAAAPWQAHASSTFDGRWQGELEVCQARGTVDAIIAGGLLSGPVTLKGGAYLTAPRLMEMVGVIGPNGRLRDATLVGNQMIGGSGVKLSGKFDGEEGRGGASNRRCSGEWRLTRIERAEPERTSADRAPTQDTEKDAPVIDAPDDVSTTDALVQIDGGVTDASAVVEFSVNGVRAPLGEDGSFEIKRGVPVGQSVVVISALDQWGNRAELEYDDNLLIYYAGHGIVDPVTERGYWLPVDADERNPANWVSTADVTDMLKAMRARHVLVIADSCYSGTLVRAGSAEIETWEARRAWLERAVEKRSRTAFSSGGLEPVQDQGGGGHSVFAGALLDVLRENDEVIDAQQLFAPVRQKVVLNANQTPQYSDIRLAGHDGGDFVFVPH